VAGRNAAQVVSTAATITGNLASTLDMMAAGTSAILSMEQAGAARLAAEQLRIIRDRFTMVGMGAAAVATLSDAITAFKGGNGELGISYLTSVMPQVAMNLSLPTAILNALLTTACGSDWSTRIIRGTLLSWQTKKSIETVGKAVAKQQNYDLDKRTAGYPAAKDTSSSLRPAPPDQAQLYLFALNTAQQLNSSQGLQGQELMSKIQDAVAELYPGTTLQDLSRSNYQAISTITRSFPTHH